MVIGDILYILQYFKLNHIFLLLISLEYCKNLEQAWKETIDKLKWNMTSFWKDCQFLVNIGNHLVV